MKTFLKFVATLAVIAGIIYVIGAGVQDGVDREEVVSCQKWQEQAAQYAPAFYIVQWQADQCAAHNITINAPVK